VRDPEKACPGLDPGWISVCGKDGRRRGNGPAPRMHELDRIAKLPWALSARFWTYPPKGRVLPFANMLA